MIKIEPGNWIKVKNEADSYLVKSVNLDTGQARLEDFVGCAFECDIREIERIMSHEEVYGFGKPPNCS